MRYVEARFDEYQREEAYRIYISKSLQLAPQGKWLQASYREMIKPKKIDNRSGDDIAMDIMKRAGLKFEG